MEEIQAQQLRERSLTAMNDAMKLVQEKKVGARPAIGSRASSTISRTCRSTRNATANVRRQVENKLQQYNTLLAQQAICGPAAARPSSIRKRSATSIC